VEALARSPLRGLVVQDSRFSNMTKKSHLRWVEDLDLRGVALDPSPAPPRAGSPAH